MARTKFPKEDDAEAGNKLQKKKKEKKQKKQKKSKDNQISQAKEQVKDTPTKVRGTGKDAVPIKKKEKKHRKHKPGMLALKEIKKYQKSTELMISRAPFRRLVKEKIQDHGKYANRIKKTAVFAIQEACEAFVTSLFEDSMRLAIHRKRVTIESKDLQLASYFCYKYNNP